MNGKLPSQALNTKENVSVVMLRSGKELEEQNSKQIKMEEEEEEIEIELSIKKKHPLPPQIEKPTNTPKVSTNSLNSSFKIISPFPLSSSLGLRKRTNKKKILEVFKKVKFNIPLTDDIMQIPKYATFLK